MTGLPRTMRALILGILILPAALGARAAESDCARGMARSLAVIKAGSAGIAAGNLLHVRQTDPEKFELVSARIAAELKSQGSAQAPELSAFLGAKYDRGMQIIANDKKPALLKTVEDEKAIEDIVLQYGAVYGQTNLEELKRIWPRLPARRKALELSEKLMAAALDKMAVEEEPAPARPPLPAAPPLPGMSVSRADLQAVRDSIRKAIQLVESDGLKDAMLKEVLSSVKGLWEATAHVPPGQEFNAAEALLQKYGQLLSQYEVATTRNIQEKSRQLQEEFEKDREERLRQIEARRKASKPPQVPPSVYPPGYKPASTLRELAARVENLVNTEANVSEADRKEFQAQIDRLEDAWKKIGEVPIPALQAQFKKDVAMRCRFILADYRGVLKRLDLSDVERTARQRLADIFSEELENMEKAGYPQA